MGFVDQLTVNGAEIAKRLDDAKHLLGEAPAGKLNDAVTLLAEAIEILALRDGVCWELVPVR